MKTHYPIKLFILLFLSLFLFVGCGETTKIIEEKPILNDLKYLIDYYDNTIMDIQMEQKGYQKLNYDSYEIYQLPNYSSQDIYCIDSPSSLSKINVFNEQLLNELKSRYTNEFFYEKVLLITSYTLSSSNNILRRMYYSHNDFCFVYDQVEGTPISNLYLIEIKLDSFSSEYLNYDINYTAELFTLNFTQFSELFETNSSNFNQTHVLVASNGPVTIHSQDQSYQIDNEEELEQFNQSIVLLGITQINSKLKEQLFFTISYDYFVVRFYSNAYIEIDCMEEFYYSGYVTSGNPYFLLYYLISKNTISYALNTQLINMCMNAYNQYLLTSSFIDKLIPLILRINILNLTSDFLANPTLTQLEIIQSYSEDFSKDEINLLKTLIGLYKKIFKNYLNNTLSFDIYYKITILEDGIEEYQIVKYNDEITISFNQKPGYLYCGAYDPYGVLYTSFQYNFYGNLYVTKHYASSLDFDIIGIDDDVCIAKYTGSDQTLFVPIVCSQGKTITKISNNAFISNTKLQSVYIANQKLGDNAFKNCTNLVHLALQKTVQEIGTNTFENCTKLANIHLQNGFQKLGTFMFKDCSSLTYINIPASLNDLSNHVFEGCVNLDTFDVSPYNAKYYAANHCIMEGTTLYYGCKNSSIPDGTVFIREFAFYGVTGLEKIYIPSCVVHIDTSAFQNCLGLKEAYISQSVMWNAKNAFNTGTNTIINCEYYQKMNGWVAQWTTGTTVNWGIPQPQQDQ